MPDPRQQDHSLGEGGLMFGKYITVYDVYSEYAADVLLSVVWSCSLLVGNSVYFITFFLAQVLSLWLDLLLFPFPFSWEERKEEKEKNAN